MCSTSLANEGRVRNLEIRSGDGQGSVGLYFPLFSVQGTFHDITIDGFDYGIRAIHEHEVNPCIEHLTLRYRRWKDVFVPLYFSGQSTTGTISREH